MKPTEEEQQQRVYDKIFGSALKQACIKNNFNNVVNLVNHNNLLINWQDEEGNSALLNTAIYNKNNPEKVMLYLIHQGANIMLINNKGHHAGNYINYKTLVPIAFNKACIKNDFENMKAILKSYSLSERKRIINLQDDKGNSALINTAIHNKINPEEIMIYLIYYGADKELKNKEGYNAGNYINYESLAHFSLIKACIKGDLPKVQGLIKLCQPLNVNWQDQEGNTALIYATMHGHSNIVKYLLNSGSDRSILNHQQHNALYYAQKEYNNDMITTLRYFSTNNIFNARIPVLYDITNISNVQRNASNISNCAHEL